MENFNYQFFEEFSKLDRVCVSVYQAEGGTSGYLAQMRNVSRACSETVPRWTGDLEQLHRYCALYQALSQSADSLEGCLCDQADVEWIRTFRSRIMERKDPLALLQHGGYRAEDDAKQRLRWGRTGEPFVRTGRGHDRYGNGHWAVWGILLALILTCVICVLTLGRL